MYRLQCKSHFDSAHFLRGYNGKCAREHGHRWEYEIVIEGKNLDNLGMLVDFTWVKAKMKELEEILDHRLLNQVSPFDVINPTAENLSSYIYSWFEGILIDYPALNLARVTVWESPDCCIKYSANMKSIGG